MNHYLCLIIFRAVPTRTASCLSPGLLLIFGIAILTYSDYLLDGRRIRFPYFCLSVFLYVCRSVFLSFVLSFSLFIA